MLASPRYCLITLSVTYSMMKELMNPNAICVGYMRGILTSEKKSLMAPKSPRHPAPPSDLRPLSNEAWSSTKHMPAADTTASSEKATRVTVEP